MPHKERHRFSFENHYPTTETPSYLLPTISTGDHRFEDMPTQYQQAALAATAFFQDHLARRGIRADVYAVGRGCTVKMEIVFHDTGVRVMTSEFGVQLAWMTPEEQYAFVAEATQEIVSAYTATAPLMEQPKQ